MAQIFFSVVKYVSNGNRAPTFGLYFFDEAGKEVVNDDIREWRVKRAATPSAALEINAIKDGNRARRAPRSDYSFHPHVAMVVASTFDVATQELDIKVENLNFPEAWAHGFTK